MRIYFEKLKKKKNSKKYKPNPNKTPIHREGCWNRSHRKYAHMKEASAPVPVRDLVQTPAVVRPTFQSPGPFTLSLLLYDWAPPLTRVYEIEKCR